MRVKHCHAKYYLDHSRQKTKHEIQASETLHKTNSKNLVVIQFS